MSDELNSEGRYFNDWLSAYMEYSRHSEAPDKFHFWTGISVLAGALRRKVWIDQGYFQWTPNFYIVFVAPPGIVSKSTTASIGMRLLRQVGGIKFGPDAVTWQALAQSLAQSTELFEVPGREEYFSMSAITIVSSEFGTFLNPNDREMVDVLVSLWDGQVGAWSKATKTQGNDSIENPWINIIACTTPDWIAGNFPEYMIGGGFTSRTVFVYAEKKRQLVAYPKKHLPKDFEEFGRRLVHDLEIISTSMAGEFTLSQEAEDWGETWYEEHYAKRPAHLDNERFAGYLARKQTHIHKLAMILSAAHKNALILEKKDLENANSLISILEHDMPKVFANIGKTDDSRDTDTLIRYLNNRGPTERVEVYRQLFTRIKFKDFQAIIESCILAGFVRQTNKNGTIYLEPIKGK
jgi:hypothetical protein